MRQRLSGGTVRQKLRSFDTVKQILSLHLVSKRGASVMVASHSMWPTVIRHAAQTLTILTVNASLNTFDCSDLRWRECAHWEVLAGVYPHLTHIGCSLPQQSLCHTHRLHYTLSVTLLSTQRLLSGSEPLYHNTAAAMWLSSHSDIHTAAVFWFSSHSIKRTDTAMWLSSRSAHTGHTITHQREAGVALEGEGASLHKALPVASPCEGLSKVILRNKLACVSCSERGTER